jgi:hypothetical protein
MQLGGIGGLWFSGQHFIKVPHAFEDANLGFASLQKKT